MINVVSESCQEKLGISTSAVVDDDFFVGHKVGDPCYVSKLATDLDEIWWLPTAGSSSLHFDAACYSENKSEDHEGYFGSKSEQVSFGLCVQSLVHTSEKGLYQRYDADMRNHTRLIVLLLVITELMVAVLRDITSGRRVLLDRNVSSCSF